MNTMKIRNPISQSLTQQSKLLHIDFSIQTPQKFDSKNEKQQLIIHEAIKQVKFTAWFFMTKDTSRKSRNFLQSYSLESLFPREVLMEKFSVRENRTGQKNKKSSEVKKIISRASEKLSRIWIPNQTKQKKQGKRKLPESCWKTLELRNGRGNISKYQTASPEFLL